MRPLRATCLRLCFGPDVSFFCCREFSRTSTWRRSSAIHPAPLVAPALIRAAAALRVTATWASGANACRDHRGTPSETDELSDHRGSDSPAEVDRNGLASRAGEAAGVGWASWPRRGPRRTRSTQPVLWTTLCDGTFPRLLDGERRPRAPIETRAGCRSPIAQVRPEKLRVLFVTEDDPLYVIQFFEVFFNIYPRSEIEICGITIGRAFHEPLRKTLRRMLGFYGPWRTFRQGLRFLSSKLRARSIESIAASAGIPVVATQSVNQPDYLEKVQAIAPDVIVSVAAPEIFKANLLGLPPLGCINIHSGRLPAYRGMMPTFWQMSRGEPAVTITVHYMAEKLDTGDVLATQRFALQPSDSLDRVIRETKREGARLVLRVLRDLRDGKADPQALTMDNSEYFSFPKREDVRAFRQRGHRLL
jgi:methionyl-tRNA formyltransferase